MKACIYKIGTPRRLLLNRGNERRLVTQHPRRRILGLAAGAAVLPAVSRVAWAQAYPTRPVRIIVTVAPCPRPSNAERWFGAVQYTAMNAVANSKGDKVKDMARRTQDAPLGQKGDGNAYTPHSCDKLFGPSGYGRCLTCMGKMGMRGPISCSILEQQL
jgi:hypothetical protein